MDNSNQQLDSLEKKIDELQRSVNKIKKIFLWILIASVAMIVMPLIGLLFAIPQFLSNYTQVLP